MKSTKECVAGATKTTPPQAKTRGEGHDPVHEEIKQWPSWKRQAYNEMFAVSPYARKY